MQYQTLQKPPYVVWVSVTASHSLDGVRLSQSVTWIQFCP